MSLSETENARRAGMGSINGGTHYKLDNLTVFLDHNGLQIDGKITEVMSRNACRRNSNIQLECNRN